MSFSQLQKIQVVPKLPVSSQGSSSSESVASSVRKKRDKSPLNLNSNLAEIEEEKKNDDDDEYDDA